MLKIKFTTTAINYLKRRGILDKTLILITDDGGGKYSIQGGSCSIGSRFSLIWVSRKDTDYPLFLQNNQGIKIYTSKYDLTMMGTNMVLDYTAGSLSLRDDEELLDGHVEIGNGAALLKANKNVKISKGQWQC